MDRFQREVQVAGCSAQSTLRGKGLTIEPPLGNAILSSSSLLLLLLLLLLMMVN